jgi:succinate-semialdehyde dehydrogenase / glutarate-semialdehyde dehydrogenase
MTLKSVNPFNQDVLAEFQELSPQELEAKLKYSQKAFQDWSNTSVAIRSELMKRASTILRDECDKYASVISREMGKIFSEAKAEINKSADACIYYADNAQAFLRDEHVRTEASKSYVMYAPTGAILAVMPWNFPFWQVFRFAVPALMAGNVALLKHASNVPQCSKLIEEIFLKAGFPDGAFQSLLINNNNVEAVLSSDVVQGLALTGSEKAGAIVGSTAAKQIKKSVLELGGSDPFIVFDDADLEQTVKVAVKSRMQNAGQSCIAAKRFIVAREIGSRFVELFKTQIEALKQGDPFVQETTTGPMARIDLAEELEGQMRKSIDLGARLVTGGKRNGANVQPALLDHVSPGMVAFDEETFGPLAAVSYFSNEAEALGLANRSRYGLGASVWSSDLERAERIARQVQSGTVYVNSLMRSDARLPFGGIKKSGYGRELSKHGMLEFVNVKSISVNEFE